MGKIEKNNESGGTIVDGHRHYIHNKVIETLGNTGEIIAYTSGNVIRQGGKIVRGSAKGLLDI